MPSGPATPLTVSLDAASTGEPISPYVYGQFIEHQGRCIYGGIWAEMLQDRKFYYPLNYSNGRYEDEAQKSPWQAASTDTVITMDSDNAYVGEHSPRVTVGGETPRGIMQAGLALRQGREYTGRVVLRGSGAVSVAISLVWGANPEDRATIPSEVSNTGYTTAIFRFNAGGDTDDGRLEILGRGEGDFLIGAVSLMPADNVNGMRADTLQLLEELGAPVYRWPGGTFVNIYNWQNAVGDHDKRPPFLNNAYWSEIVESNDFGPDEFMLLMKLLDAEAYVTVGAVTAADAELAAAEVEYFNGGQGTTMGQLRAANGHPEPYGVRFWGVGNETMTYAPLNDYVELHKQMAAAMRAVDPASMIVAVGGYGVHIQPGEDWGMTMLTEAGSLMNLISEHFYAGDTPEGLSDDLVEYSHAIAEGFESPMEAHRGWRQQYPEFQDIGLAFDEWNYIWNDRPSPYGEAGVRYVFKDALGIATAQHEFIRNSDVVYMANTHAVNVNGHIKTTATDAAFEATALPLVIYRHHFGTLPISIDTDTSPLDVAAAWTEERSALTIGAVNPTEENYALTLDLQNAQLTGGGQFWIVTSDDPLAYNEPGQPPRVVIQEGTVTGDSSTLTVPALSAILYRLPAAAGTTSAPSPQATQSAGQSSLFRFINTFQVTPDDYHVNAGFVRVNYIQSTGNLAVTFGGYPTQAGTALYGCQQTGDYYKEYTLDMVEMGKRGALLCDRHGDLGSLLIGDDFYLAGMDQDPVSGYAGWKIIKYDAATWEVVTELFHPLYRIGEQEYKRNGDPMLAYVNGQLDISAGYNENGAPPPTASHHQFFTTALEFLSEKILTDTPHIDGASMIYLDGTYYFVTADAFDGDVVVMQYDQNWNYLGVKTLIEQAHFSTGLAYDGKRFYLAYLDTSQRTTPGFLPVYLNVHLAVFDRQWNLVEDLAVTSYVPDDHQQPGRPSVLLHGNRVYVSYDVGDETAPDPLLTMQGYVSVYELTQKP
jgi:alpha-N-arabinofuranosidase